MRDFDTEHYYINLDLKPALDEEKLDRRLLRDLRRTPTGTFGNVLRASLCLMVLVLRSVPASRRRRRFIR